MKGRWLAIAALISPILVWAKPTLSQSNFLVGRWVRDPTNLVEISPFFPCMEVVIEETLCYCDSLGERVTYEFLENHVIIHGEGGGIVVIDIIDRDTVSVEFLNRVFRYIRAEIEIPPESPPFMGDLGGHQRNNLGHSNQTPHPQKHALNSPKNPR